jgi:hypothetical protein
MMREDSKKVAWCAPVLILVVMALVLAGCGNTSPAESTSPVTSVIDLKSSGVEANGATRSNVHCGWGAIWVPLEWKAIPADTKELAIYIGRFKYVNEGGTRKLTVPYADLVSEIKPSLRRLSANVLPEGAGWSNVGSTSCPVAKRGQHVLVEVFALDRRQAQREMKQRLAIRLTAEALADPHPSAGPREPGKLTRDAAAVGRFITTYPGPH